MKNHIFTPEVIENSKNAPKKSNRSIKSIIWNKLLDNIENATFSQISIFLLLCALSFFLTLLFTYTDQTVEFAMKFLTAYNFLAIKFVVSVVIVFNFWKIFDALKPLPEENEVKATGNTIEWIPVVELLDHLFEFESFKRDDIEDKFGIPRNRFTDLAKKLESLHVLIRGENNSRILNPEFSRSDIAIMLEGKSSTEELKPLNRMTSETSGTSEPSGKTIIERVSEFLTQEREVTEVTPLPSRRFELRKINSDAQPLQ